MPRHIPTSVLAERQLRTAQYNVGMNTVESASKLGAVINEVLTAQHCDDISAFRFFLWRTAERQIQDAMEAGCSTKALTDVEQYIAEYVCRLAEDSVWLEIGTPGRVVLVWPDGSAYLHQNESAVLLDIFKAGQIPKGQWLDGNSVFTNDQKLTLETTVRKLIAEQH